MSFYITQFIAIMATLVPLFSNHLMYLEKHWIFVNVIKPCFMLCRSLAISLRGTIFFLVKWSTFIEKKYWFIKYSFMALWSLSLIFFHSAWHSVLFCFVWIFYLYGICNMSICYTKNYRYFSRSPIF